MCQLATSAACFMGRAWSKAEYGQGMEHLLHRTKRSSPWAQETFPFTQVALLFERKESGRKLLLFCMVLQQCFQNISSDGSSVTSHLHKSSVYAPMRTFPYSNPECCTTARTDHQAPRTQKAVMCFKIAHTVFGSGTWAIW